MARKSNAPSKAAPSKEYLVPDMASESESDNEYRYKLPHYATPTSQKSSKKGSVGTPNRPIKIPDISAGSASQPIWISDAETTDYDTETDVSNIAIRGTRTPKTRPGRSPVSVHSQPQQKKSPAKKGKSPQKKAPVVAKKAEESVEPNETTESKPKKSTQAKDSEESANEKKSKRFPRMIVKPKKPVVDMNALSEEGDDKDLEKELKEIALNGRSGMISGTPGAFDLEKGKKRTSGSSAPAGEDDADRSWHTPFSLNKPTNSRRQKLYLLVAILGLITVTSCLILVIKSGKNRSSDVFFDEPAMDVRQEQMHKVVTRVTDSDILGNPTTAQFKARRWLLFRDDEISEFDEDRVIQRYSLACFFFATAGDEKWNQNNWMDGHECDNDWMGINCNEAGKVRAIVLDNEGLSGTIPPEVGHLINLEHLILKNNPGLYGWIPSTLGHMKALSQLGLYKNALSGTIPDLFEHSNEMMYINLEENSMFGSIPGTIRNLKKLETLALGNNKFDGMIPLKDLSQSKIKYLGLNGNEFSGMLDQSIEDITTLEHLYLNKNKIGGPIPRELASLTNLRSMDLGDNQFTGRIPTEIGALESLEFLSMMNNQLRKELPVQLGRLTNMKTLNLASNELTGSLPNISNMNKLVNLQLFENQLSGSLPEAIQQLQSIEILFLSSNQFSGTIPQGIKRLSRTLRGLYLSDNGIQGRIPTQLCEFTSLEALFLDTNSMFGPIPSCMGDLTQLQQLYLFQNQFSGDVPSTLENLTELSGLGLEQTDLSGEMPDGVCNLVDEFSLDIWADCVDQFGSEPLLCDCCSVCCPSEQCS